jgi:hypothetical protein
VSIPRRPHITHPTDMVTHPTWSQQVQPTCQIYRYTVPALTAKHSFSQTSCKRDQARAACTFQTLDSLTARSCSRCPFAACPTCNAYRTQLNNAAAEGPCSTLDIASEVPCLINIDDLLVCASVPVSLAAQVPSSTLLLDLQPTSPSVRLLTCDRTSLSRSATVASPLMRTTCSLTGALRPPPMSL